jgi:hypothetical protein
VYRSFGGEAGGGGVIMYSEIYEGYKASEQEVRHEFEEQFEGGGCEFGWGWRGCGFGLLGS